MGKHGAVTTLLSPSPCGSQRELGSELQGRKGRSGPLIGSALRGTLDAIRAHFLWFLIFVWLLDL